jgi:hypothetical protein
VCASGVASAAPPHAWLGTFTPEVEPGVSPTREVVARAGVVTVLTPADGSPVPTGDVAVVQPLLGMNIATTLTDRRAKLALFGVDRREYASSVLVVPADAQVRFVVPSASDVKSIRAALAKEDSLSGVKRALADLEIGAIDVDGDGKADFAITYGCTVWGDGLCQVHGQFSLSSAKGAWREMQ